MSDARTLDDRAQDRAIREWAQANGLDVKAQGRIPNGVKIAWQSAMAGSDDPADLEPAADIGAGDLADPDPADLEPPQPPPGPDPAADDAGSLPPPADLDEARARLARRPRGRGWSGKQQEQRKQRGSSSSKAPSKAVIADVEGKLVLLLALPAMTASRIDPVCGGAFADNVEKMAKAWAPLICQSADIVRFFQSATLFMLWLTALQSMVPVAEAVYEHHFSRDARREAQQQPRTVTVPDDDLSMYAVPTGHIPQPQAG